MRGIFAMMILTLLAVGCAGSGVGGVQVGTRAGQYATLSNQLHYLILTDGQMGSYGVTGYPVLGSFFKGEIDPAAKTLGKIEYKADRRCMTIGGTRYRLSEGNLFIIETGGKGLNVKQLKSDVHQHIHGLVGEIPELKAFCTPVATVQAR